MLRPLRPRLRLARALVVIAVGYAVTAVVPARLDRHLGRSVAWVYLKTHQGMVRVVAERMRARLSPAGREADFDNLARANLEMLLEDDLGRIRGLHRRGWRPDIELEGVEHLEAALANGRGVVLWRMSFASSPVAKVALWEAGHPLVHLSSPRHGASRWQGKFWGRHLPGILIKAETRFLKERILITDSGFEYLRLLLSRLEANEVVSIFGDTLSSAQSRPVPVLGLTREFATGSPSLARLSGCALLPVHSVWLGPQRYRVVIESPIEVDMSLTRSQFIQQAIEEFASRLERRILENPASWTGWNTRGRMQDSSTVMAGGAGD